MKKWILTGILTALCLGAAGCGGTTNPKETIAESKIQAEELPLTLTTKDGMMVTFDHIPQRILSTNPNTGEQLMALGLGDKIIGTCYNNASVADEYKKEYEEIPVIADKYPSLEAVLDLSPDFIYGRSSAFSDKDTAIATHDKLSGYGIASLSSIEGYQLGCDVEDVYQDFYNLGRIFQVEDRAEKIVSDMKHQIAQVEEKLQAVEPVKVFDFDSMQSGGAYTPGNHLVSKLIRRGGGINIFEDLEKTWNTVSWEAVVEADPDVILINDYGEMDLQEKIDLLNSIPALAGVKAIKNQNFVVITLPELFASARVGDTVEKLARGFHPEVFQ